MQIRGVRVRDAAYTYLGTDPADIHGMPSGGSLWTVACTNHGQVIGLCNVAASFCWRIQVRVCQCESSCVGVIELVNIEGNLFTRVDGNGIFLSNYNRNATIKNNEMSWIGDSAIAAWGTGVFRLGVEYVQVQQVPASMRTALGSWTGV